MKKEVIEKFAILVTGAFAFVSALAWNSAIQQLFRDLLPQTNSLPAMFAYAIIITVFAVFVTLWIAKLKPEKAKK